MRIWLTILLAALLPGLLVAEDFFAKGNAAFNEKNFSTAIAHYEKAVEDGVVEANLFYNLGNAYFRDKQPGLAALSYERALLLEPRHREARANLALIHNHSGARLFENPLPFFVSETIAAYTLSMGGWLAFGALGAVFLARKKYRPWLVTTGILALLAGGAGAVCLKLTPSRVDMTIVLAEDAKAYYAPARSAKIVDALPAGSQTRMVDGGVEWAYIELPGGQRGWISRDAIAPVAP